jgi:uncharacterized RDD family membrane protein YckC
MVPLLGFATWALASVVGLGAATVTLRAMIRQERPAAPPRETSPPSPGFAPTEPIAPPPGAPASAAFAPSLDAPPPPSMPPPVDPAAPRPAFTNGLAAFPRATFLDRLAAFALDCVLVGIAAALMELDRYEGFFFLMLLGYHVAFWAWKGTTLGGIICNVRVVRTHGTELQASDAIVRGLSAVFSLAALGIGCLWMLQDPEGQMWHDKIAGTLVVKVPREMVLA